MSVVQTIKSGDIISYITLIFLMALHVCVVILYTPHMTIKRKSLSNVDLNFTIQETGLEAAISDRYSHHARGEATELEAAKQLSVSAQSVENVFQHHFLCPSSSL